MLRTEGAGETLVENGVEGGNGEVPNRAERPIEGVEGTGEGGTVDAGAEDEMTEEEIEEVRPAACIARRTRASSSSPRMPRS
jgi:hypothetical protein